MQNQNHTMFPHKVEQWQSIIGNFYKNKSITNASKKNENGSISLHRLRIPGMSIIDLESIFPYDVPYSRLNEESVFAMHFMMKGEMHYALQKINTHFNAGQNNIIIIPKKSVSSLNFSAHTPYSYRSIILEHDYLEHLVHRYPQQLEKLYHRYINNETACLDHHNLNNSCDINMILSQMDHVLRKGRATPLLIEGKILELLSLQINSTQCKNFTIVLSDSDLAKIREARRLLTLNLFKSPGIKQLSRQIGLNEKKLKCGFKQVFHQTIYGFLTNCKMNLAQSLLQNSDRSIAEVGMECGYEYASHFSTVFKRKFGISPKDFRASCKR